MHLHRGGPHSDAFFPPLRSNGNVSRFIRSRQTESRRGGKSPGVEVLGTTDAETDTESFAFGSSIRLARQNKAVSGRNRHGFVGCAVLHGEAWSQRPIICPASTTFPRLWPFGRIVGDSYKARMPRL